jgi:hypothetical protein
MSNLFSLLHGRYGVGPKSKDFGLLEKSLHFFNYGLSRCPPLRFGQVFGSVLAKFFRAALSL